jgi:hypothetical protein
MHYWYCDPGRWAELSLEAQGKMLAFYRDKNTMTAYEDKVHADKLKKQNKSKQRGKYK